MSCSICQHGDRQAIEAAVSRGDSYRTISGAYGVSKSTLARHLSQCPGHGPAASQAVPMPTMWESAPAYLVNATVHAEAMRLAADLPTSQQYLNDPRRAVAAVLELLMKVIKASEG